MASGITIYDRDNGVFLSNVPIKSEAVHEEEMMRSDFVKLSWNDVVSVTLPVGAYIKPFSDGVKYRLFEPYVPTQVSEAEWNYEPQFQHPKMYLGKTLFERPSKDSAANDVNLMIWQFTGPVEVLLTDIVGVINRTMIANGDMDDSEDKFSYTIIGEVDHIVTVSFDKTDVLSALTQICNTLDAEYHIDWRDRRLLFGKVAFDRDEQTPVLVVGRNVKIPSARDAKEGYWNAFEPQGGSRNISRMAASGEYVQSNVRLSLIPLGKDTDKEHRTYPVPSPSGGTRDMEFPDGIVYTDGNGVILTKDEFNAAKQMLFKKPIVFDEIFPKLDMYVYDVRYREQYLLASNSEKDTEKVIERYDDEGNPIYKRYAVWYIRLAYETSESPIGWKDYTIEDERDFTTTVKSIANNGVTEESRYIRFTIDKPFSSSLFTNKTSTYEYAEAYIVQIEANECLVTAYVHEGSDKNCEVLVQYLKDSSAEWYERDRQKVEEFAGALKEGDSLKFVGGVNKRAFPRLRSQVIDGKSPVVAFSANTEHGSETSPLAGRGSGDGSGYGFKVEYIDADIVDSKNNNARNTMNSEEEGTGVINAITGEPDVIKAGDYEIIFEQNDTLIIPTTKKEGLIPRGKQLPSKLGNKVTLYNIVMDGRYEEKARQDLVSETLKYIANLVADNNTYTVSSNPVEFERETPDLYVGGKVILDDGNNFDNTNRTEHQLQTRIMKLVTKLDYSFEQEITVGNKVIKGSQAQMKEQVQMLVSAGAGGGEGVGIDESVVRRIIRTFGGTMFLSKQSDDIAQGVIGFVSGLWVKAKGLFGIDGDGNGRFNNIDFSGILSGLRAVINNIESGNYDGDGTSGSGWQLTNDDGTGNSRLVVDNLYVRMKSVYNELEIRKMLHTAGNYIFSPSGSIIEQVDYYAGDELLGYEAVKVPWVLRLVPLSLRGKLLSRTRMRKVSTLSDDDKARVTKFRCWVVADDGTTRTINTWKVGMLARCETFNVAGGKDAHADNTDSGIISEVSEVSGKATGNKFYWREVTETGEGQKLHVDDGKVHNYVDLTNEDGFFFPGSDWPSAGDSIVCYGVTDESLAEYSNIVIIETVGADAPAIKEFQNVGLWGDGETRKGAVNWSLAGKMRTKISPRTGNKFYGEFLVWVKDGWQDMTTTFEIRLGEVRSEIRAVRDTNMLTGVIDGSGWVDFEERLVKAGVTRDGGLYSASGKIISPFFDGGHELYYFSFYAKGEVTLKLNRYSDDGDDRTADMVSSEVLHVSVADGDTYNGMQRYYTNAQVTEGFYCLLFEGTSADNAVYFPQAEEGQLTPFVVSGMETGSAITQSADRISLEVKNVRDGLLSTGIDIEHDEIRLRSNKTSFVSTRDGHTYIGVGEDDDGIPYFIFYDKDGEPKYNLGYTGLKELIDNARPSRYEAVSFYCDAPYGFQPGEKLNPKTVYDNFDADTVPFWYWYEGYTKGADGSKIWSVGGTEASKWNEKYYSDKEETDTPSHPKNFAGLNDEEYDFSGWFFQKTDSFSGSSISGFNCLVKYIENGVVAQTFYASVELNSIIALTGKPPEVWYRISLYRTKEARDKNEWPAWSGYANSKGKNEDDDSDAFSEYMTVPIEAGGKRGSLVMPSPTD